MSERTDVQTAWVLANRDTEKAAWVRLYEELHPRPAVADDEVRS